MTTFIVYTIVFVSAFLIGRYSVKTPMPLSIYELNELRRDNSKSIHSRIEKAKNRILDFVEEVGEITNDDVEDLILVSDATARRYLNELEREGKLKQIGQTGRGVHYTLAEIYKTSKV